MAGVVLRAFNFSSARNGSYRTTASCLRLVHVALHRTRMIERLSERNNMLSSLMCRPARRNRAEPSLEEQFPDAFAVWTT